MKNIAAAFVKAQAGFAPALKTSTNPHFKSKYADLAACVEAVIDSLNANGIGLIQRAHEDANGVTVETVFIHESGEQIDCGRLHVPAAKNDPQGYGSALTYARRYSLMAACGIAPEDDDGNAATKARQQQTKAERDAEAKRKQRGQELEDLAMHLIDCHRDNRDLEAIEIWYDPETWTKEDEQDEMKYVWGLLKTESKLRSTIKANNPREKDAGTESQADSE